MTTKELIEVLQKLEAEHGVLPVSIEINTAADIRDETNTRVHSIGATVQKCEFSAGCGFSCCPSN
jgi:hypothetical protein